jgi:hypothetical protein
LINANERLVAIGASTDAKKTDFESNAVVLLGPGINDSESIL